MTLWTDWGYPVFNFNLYLTGYDVQAINLADILRVGVIGSTAPTTPSTPSGALSASVSPNLSGSLNCGGIFGLFPATLAAALRDAFTKGTSSLFIPPGTSCSAFGGTNANATFCSS